MRFSNHSYLKPQEAGLFNITYLLLVLHFIAACSLLPQPDVSPTASQGTLHTPIKLGPTWTPEQTTVRTVDPTAEPTTTSSPCESIVSVPEGWIAFSSAHEAVDEIYIMRADGGGELFRITDSQGIDANPSWSPSGEKLAIESDRGLAFGKTDILVIDLEGTILHRFGSPASVESHPQWSPDGQDLAYSSSNDGKSSIVIANVGREIQNIIRSPFPWNIKPSWSPDGNFLIWLANDGTSDAYFDIMLYDTFRNDTTDLTNGFQVHPWIYYTWAPDGSTLAFTLYRDEIFDIHLLDIDSHDMIRLTDDKARDLEPSWSPDGERLAFISDRGGNYDLYVINRDGTGVRQLTDTDTTDQYPAWSPDGSYIAFLAKADHGGDVIHIARADGCTIHELTDAISSNVTRPVWSPTLVR